VRVLGARLGVFAGLMLVGCGGERDEGPAPAPSERHGPEVVVSAPAVVEVAAPVAAKGPAPAPAVVEVAAPVVAAPAPRRKVVPTVVADDQVFLVVEQGGVVRHSAGQFSGYFAGASSVRDIAVRRAGGLYVATRDGLHRVDGDRVDDIPAPPVGGVPDAIAAAPDDALLGVSDHGLARFDGATWTETAKGAILGERHADTLVLKDVVVDTSGEVYVLEVGGLYREPRGKARHELLPLQADALFEAIAAGADGSVVVLQSSRLYHRSRHGGWTRLGEPLGEVAMRCLDIARDGTITAAGWGALAVVRPGSESPERIDLAPLGVLDPVVHAVARDSDDNLWISTNRAVVVLSPTAGVVHRWEVGSTPGIDAAVTQLHVLYRTAGAGG